jgi:beta-N-acetylhexosaminidase
MKISVSLTGAALAAALVAALAYPAQARLEAPWVRSPQSVAAAAYARMTPAQRVGQLFMAGVPTAGPSASLLTSLRASHVGSVILDGASAKARTAMRTETAGIAARLRQTGVDPFISTDQEGGEVQRLTGPGFSVMPSALAQGRLTRPVLRAAATTWGSELAAAGVNLDLAPVADTVPAKDASTNQPIGAFDREFGHTPSVVAAHVVAFIRGMNAGGVDTTAKHFPGLGRATGNTDTTPHVTDPTTRHSPYITPFRDAVKAGTQFVMVSSATYPNIDAHHVACFSTTIITGMLRGDLGFQGVVISDDLGTSALSRFSLATRALDFFAAGGTMLLDTSPGQLPAMIRAVVAKEASSPSFAKAIQAAVLTVLVAKANASLVSA